ncbi:MAG: glycoside hydrolase family 3 C-terminal domain-containing protein, partial [Oscillospiraceae bacterium]
ELLQEDTITEAVERLFTARFRLGMFDVDCEYDQIPYDVVECPAHRALNRKMAQESIVLLKNNGVLPLKSSGNIAVIGPNADDESVLLGNYNGTPSRYTTLLQGIQRAASGKVLYARGCHVYDDHIHDWAEQPLHEAIIAAQKSDLIILCIGLNPSMEGEEGDAYNGAMSGDKKDIELPDSQKKLFRELVKTGKPIVAVNVSGSCVNLTEQAEACEAVLQCFYPGAEGGDALADILFGKVSPSGRLPVTFYKSTADLPPFEEYAMENRTYKFFKGTPLYPFGHGLTFSDISENWLTENTVEVSNSGEVDTNYTVLRYEYIPHKNLCGIKKIFIRRGETVKIEF